jgi:putative sterol carrier protein
MAFKFPSKEWVDQFVHEINTSTAYASAAETWEGDVMLVIEDAAAVYLDLWHGKCRAATYLADPNARSAEFKISAGLDKWQKILDGKLDPIQGLMTGQIKLDGNLAKVMKNIKAAQELVRCATRVKTEF